MVEPLGALSKEEMIRMFGNKGIAVLLILSLGCANPKYLLQEPNFLGGQGGSSKPIESTNCDLKFAKPDLCLSWYWENRPTPSEAGSLIVKLFRPNNLDGSPVLVTPEASLMLLLWMPSMNHGSTPTLTQEIDIGTFRIQEVFFIMPGEWDLRFQLQVKDQIQDEVRVEIRI